jgi:uncharacterized membrane protein YtjA (UPF0391 family)
MLRWAVIFLVIAIVAGILGFAGLMVAAAGIAKLLFYLFLILFLITLISGLVNRNKVWDGKQEIGKRYEPSPLSSKSGAFDKYQRRRINAVAQAGRLRSIVKHVPKVSVAPAARHCIPSDPEAMILDRFDILSRNRRPEARPARPWIELRFRTE